MRAQSHQQYVSVMLNDGTRSYRHEEDGGADKLAVCHTNFRGSEWKLMWTSMYVFTYLCTHACMHVCVYVCVYVLMYACMYLCTSVSYMHILLVATHVSNDNLQTPTCYI